MRFDGLGTEIPSLCRDCETEWRSELLDTCGSCGQPISVCACVPEELKRAGCVGYRKRVYYLQGKPSSVQNQILYRIKHRPAARAVAFLAEELSAPLLEMLAEAETKPNEAVLVYLPRSRRSAAVNGTDQAKRLMKAIAARTGLQTCFAIRRRVNRNQIQRVLSPRQRRENAKRSYVLKKGLELSHLKGKSVVLIDDIVTTGATVAAGVRLLRGIGVKHVFALSVAYDDVNKNVDVRQPFFRI
ncbi:MAG: ComF family protein [Clostridia bacterium]|nr:ComF family protein [Clostridia bacterium]